MKGNKIWISFLSSWTKRGAVRKKIGYGRWENVITRRIYRERAFLREREEPSKEKERRRAGGSV